ncbi:hypothetical protein MAM1_0014d01391 [Mucor ambiguus]|uniref:C2H2-type domain-containing protein n=1 Tax=Mucor ambiguus TaxID=91626 RepID=A0A0C9M5V0_9FUNG|nr:hypothetical protein MAM1_0014d01391 [Mucor ambiguus]
MKLRVKRGASGSIKQEYKFAVGATETSPVIMDEGSTLGINIKQEDAVEREKLSQKDTNQSSQEDYFYQCDLCNQRMASFKSVLEHRKSIHNVKQWKKRMYKDVDAEPDIHDPNFYCKSCEACYRDANAFRKHLKSTHHMVLKPIPRRDIPQNDIVPDPDDPSLCCKSCNRTYKHRSTYRRHCTNVHAVNRPKLGNRAFTPNSINNAYCQLCNRRFADKHWFRNHLFAIHKVDWRLVQQEWEDVLPDINDPNFYCSSCEKKLANKISFKRHLTAIHYIQLSHKKSSLGLDAHDPNKYCGACCKTYRSKAKYRTHLRVMHQMAQPSSRARVEHRELPDPYNPHYYCSACQKSWKTRHEYRKHYCRVAINLLSLLFICNMKLRKRPLRTSSIVKQEYLVESKGASGCLQLNNTFDDDQHNKNTCGLTFNIKNEEPSKYELIHDGEASQGILSEMNTLDFNDGFEARVKPEELSKPEAILRGTADSTQNVELSTSRVKVWVPPPGFEYLEPDINDPNFHCRSCKRTYKNKYNYRCHLKRHHKMELKSLTGPINPDILPDWDDPNSYCKSCDRTYISQKYFRFHCKRTHRMWAAGRVLENPDLDDPNNYCKICNHTFKKKREYLMHCADVHAPRIFANPDATPDIKDPNNYCIKCDKTFKQRVSFKAHLYKIHQFAPPTPRKMKPKLNDPNNYCRTCDKKMVSKERYHYHLSVKHGIGKMPKPKSKMYPHSNDPNNYCRVCKRTYASRGTYTRHLSTVHPTVLQPPRVGRKTLPDPYDPNFYCRECDITHKTLNLFRTHCKLAHHMELLPTTVVNPHATIDINHPQLYCSQCEHRFHDKYAFVVHLNRTHELQVTFR